MRWKLGNSLSAAEHHQDALIVREAELSMKRRIGASEHNILAVQANLAGTHIESRIRRLSAHGARRILGTCVGLFGEEHEETILAAHNHAKNLSACKRFEEARTLLRKDSMPVARRVLGENHETRSR